MDDASLMNLLTQIPNFAGFLLLALFLYRALMQALENNKSLSEKIVQCYRSDPRRSRPEPETPVE